jgi:peptidoglycan/xylan/chitin deacetylase (PgdA/CDA1 family)
MQGIFTISLDFELHWGVFDKKNRQSRTACYQNTLQLIPELLRLFEQFEVHVTWATVGGVFAQDRFEWEQLKPTILPEYMIQKYSAYAWIEQNGLPENLYFAHFAPQAVNSILQYKGQELGTHTFGHYYCLEKQHQAEAFDADLKAAKKTASKFNNKPISLVFPRNQFNEESLKVCYENGIKVVRSNPANWFWAPVADGQPQLMRKVFRTGDAYVQLGHRTSYPLSSIEVKQNEPIQLRASRFLRPWNPKYRIINKLSLRRIVEELKTAAIEKECYHLWWHPENFGDHPEQNISTLKVVLEEYKKWKNKYGMMSWNMGEYEKQLLKN